MRDLNLLADPTHLAQLKPEELAGAMAELLAVTSMLGAELAALAVRPPVEASPKPLLFRLLTVPEVAERSRKSVRWIRDNWRKELPFGFRKGRTLVFPQAEFEKWLRRP